MHGSRVVHAAGWGDHGAGGYQGLVLPILFPAGVGARMFTRRPQVGTGAPTLMVGRRKGGRTSPGGRRRDAHG